MRNPLRTLLHDLFVAPILSALRGIFDWLGDAATAVGSGLKINQDRINRIHPAKGEMRRDTRSHLEKMGVIVPVYSLVSKGFSDHEIAVQLSLTENTVYRCIGYLVRRLKCRTRAELALYASPQPNESWNLRSSPKMLITRVRRWRQRRLADSL